MIFSRSTNGKRKTEQLKKQRFLYDLDIEAAKQMEKERKIEDFKIGYNQGFLDAQCNHINDADNAANEHDYTTNNDINEL